MKDLKKQVVQKNSQLFLQYSEIVKKIAQARSNSSCSQGETAELIGVSRRTIIDFDKCDGYNWIVFVALCDKFGITLDLFYTLE